jgi:hypothetical protein
MIPRHLLKRKAERFLRWIGIPKRKAVRIVSKLF